MLKQYNLRAQVKLFHQAIYYKRKSQIIKSCTPKKSSGVGSFQVTQNNTESKVTKDDKAINARCKNSTTNQLTWAVPFPASRPFSEAHSAPLFLWRENCFATDKLAQNPAKREEGNTTNTHSYINVHAKQHKTTNPFLSFNPSPCPKAVTKQTFFLQHVPALMMS